MKRALIILLLIAGAQVQLFAQTDSTRRAWWIPNYGKLQYAGSIGFFSVGPGYEIWQRRLELEAMVGYVPDEYSGNDFWVLSLKQNIKPYRTEWGQFRWAPLYFGIYQSYSFGEQFFLDAESSGYPDDYYWWSSAFRYGGHLGTEVEYHFEPGSAIRFISGYFEMGTNDIHIYSWGTNQHTIETWEIIKFGLGLKVAF